MVLSRALVWAVARMPDAAGVAVQRACRLAVAVLAVRGRLQQGGVHHAQVGDGLELELVQGTDQGFLIVVHNILLRGAHVANDAIAGDRDGARTGVLVLGEVGGDDGEVGVDAAVVGLLVACGVQLGLDLCGEIGDGVCRRVVLAEDLRSLGQHTLQLRIALDGGVLGGQQVRLHHGVVQGHGGVEVFSGAQADIVHITRERVAGFAANGAYGQHAGGLDLGARIGADGVDQFAVHVQMGLLELVFELELNPLVGGQGVVEGVRAVLAGDAHFAGFLLDGHDLAVGGLEQHLLVLGIVRALDLDAQTVAQPGGLEAI